MAWENSLCAVNGNRRTWGGGAILSALKINCKRADARSEGKKELIEVAL
jgi:hypothetical protein